MTGVLGHAKMERFFQPGGPITVSIEFCLEMARIFDEHYEGATALSLGAGKTNHMGLVDTAAACGSDMMTATPEGCPAGQPGICSTTVYDNSGNQGPFYNGEAGVSVWFTTHPKTEAGYDEEEKAAYVQGECIDRNGVSNNEGWVYCLLYCPKQQQAESSAVYRRPRLGQLHVGRLYNVRCPSAVAAGVSLAATHASAAKRCRRLYNCQWWH